jgi:transcriptional regulator with XRE-family HTH domain
MGGIHTSGPIDPAFGRRVAELRRERGMTQLILAADAGCSVRSVQQIEHGRLSPSLRFVGKLARALGVQFRCEFVLPSEDMRNERRAIVSVPGQQAAG